MRPRSEGLGFIMVSLCRIINPQTTEAEHNLPGGDFDTTLIDAKWESLALAPCLDRDAPNDYFLFTVSDNDFITINGSILGQPYSSNYGRDVNSQALVFRVTLPTVKEKDVKRAIGI